MLVVCLMQMLKNKKISKADLCALFIDPKTNTPLSHTCRRFPIHWCHHELIKNKFWEKWWMVFDQPPCNNHEVPQ